MAGIQSSATVASGNPRPGTRDRILAAEACPLSTAIESVVELQAALDDTIAAQRRGIDDAHARHRELLRRRDLLRALASELEARLIAQPRRERRKRVA